ncbi:MAG: thiamine-phosphate kinase [Candidatus Krumholzibacteria bacterium]|nr:thiamine-phosphate kinase [Candidatus Krumholzibacteria bacterium]
MKELEVIGRLRAAFPDCGIGDDAAVLPAPRGEMLLAADAAVEGVHFDRRFSTLSQAVQKLVTSNVSDIFAMGGSPGSIVFTAALPPGCAPADVDAIIDGLKRSCTQYGIRLAGGDTVSSPHGFCFNVAIVGEVRPGRAVLRAGARVGDALVLFGEIGLSLAGLSILSSPTPELKKAISLVSIASSPAELDQVAAAIQGCTSANDAARFVQRHLVPLAFPLDAALLDADPACITAMIDISDGLGKDLRTLCAESGVGALIREDALPIPPAIGEVCGLEGEALTDFALASGEEYVMLAAVSPEAAKRLGAGAAGGSGGGSTVIGSVVRAAEGINLVGASGKKRPMPNLGYEHSF